GKVVVDLADLRAHLPLDRDHAVEQVAEEPQLDAGGGNEQPNETLHAEGVAAEQKSGAGEEGEDDREEGDEVGTDAEANESRRKGFRPCTIAALERASLHHEVLSPESWVLSVSR